MRNKVLNIFSLEGADGAGKSTQIPLVKKMLEDKGYEVDCLKSPDATLLGKFIRKNVKDIEPWIRNRLFMIDIESTIRQIDTSNKKTIYLWDRYIDSFYVSNKEMTLKEALDLTKDLPKPRITFLLRLEVEDIFSSRQKALDDHSEPDWLRQKISRYDEIVSKDPKRFEVIDATKNILEITKIITNRIDLEIKK